MNGNNEEKYVNIYTKVTKDVLKDATLAGMKKTGKPVMLDGEVAAYAIELLAGLLVETTTSSETATASPAQNLNVYEWHSDSWMIELPSGTLVSFPYKKRELMAEIDEYGIFKHQDKETSPTKWVRTIAGTSRNARASLRIKRPTDADFIPAKELFATAAVKSKRERKQEIGDDILYTNFVATLNKLESFGNFSDDMFRDLHHTGSSLSSMRKYAENGINAGNEGARCQWDSNNGRIFRRVQEVLQHINGTMNTAEVRKLVDGAIKKVPFLD